MEPSATPEPATVTLFLCGDVMTGRGIDQILPHPAEPHLYEPYMRSALGYLEIAEQATGQIERPADFAYIWGDALGELERARPEARIVNLETAVTVAEDAWPDKGINYRMNPANVRCLLAAGIDCCVLANNHVLDWATAGSRKPSTRCAVRGAIAPTLRPRRRSSCPGEAGCSSSRSRRRAPAFRPNGPQASAARA